MAQATKTAKKAVAPRGVKPVKKTWSRMNKVEKKKALCKDVIKHVKSGLVSSKQGAYVDFIAIDGRYDLDFEIADKQLNKLITPKTKNICEVCAKGALFLSDVINRNHCTVIEAQNIDSPDIVSRLSNVFSKDELDLIEAAFEKDYCNYNSIVAIPYTTRSGFSAMKFTPAGKAAVKFGKAYRNSDDRLIAIMKNVIRYGEFKPEKLNLLKK